MALVRAQVGEPPFTEARSEQSLRAFALEQVIGGNEERLRSVLGREHRFTAIAAQAASG